MPYRAQSVNRLTERVHAAIRASAGRARVDRVLIACSGGADSTCLAHAVAATAHMSGWAATIGHVRHGVRDDDGGDADAVSALADRLHVPFRSVALNDLGRASDRPVSEDRLRTRRYDALSALAEEVGAQAVLTGHTMDDQAETVLLHLIRGAGIDGLAAIAPDSVLPVHDASLALSRDQTASLRVLRPLLDVRREETVAYCLAHDLPFVHDPTNDDQTWTRNWLRHTVLPELRTRNPDIARTLARAAAHLARDAAFLRDETDRALVRCGHRCEDGVSMLRQSAFAAEPMALRSRMLRYIATVHTSGVPVAEAVERAATRLAISLSSRIVSFGPLSCSIIGGEILCGTAAAVRKWILNEAAAATPLHLGEVCLRVAVPHIFRPLPGTRWVYACAVRAIRHRAVGGEVPESVQEGYLALPEGAALSIRTRQPGDRFRPANGAHSRRLQDYLSERGVPEFVRDRLPLLVVNGTIAWVIGHEFSADFAATGADATHFAAVWRHDG